MHSAYSMSLVTFGNGVRIGTDPGPAIPGQSWKSPLTHMVLILVQLTFSEVVIGKPRPSPAVPHFATPAIL
jgi:hypothetical protein